MAVTRKTWLALALALIIAASLVWGVAIEPALIVERSIQRPKWPGTEIKVAFLSDLHAGAPHIDIEYIEKLIAQINSASPDLVLIGGDLVINGVVGGSPIPFSTVAAALGRIRAHLGVFAVLGNHDWWSGAEQISAELSASGIKVLENQSELIERHDGSKLWLVGIGDDYTDHSDVRRAFASTDQLWPKIVFMHDPASLFDIKDRFQVAFAGHLHGGQIFVPGIGAIVTPGRAPRTWAKGWIEFELGALFVSSGIGTSDVPRSKRTVS